MTVFTGIAGAVGGVGRTAVELYFPNFCVLCGSRTNGEPACGCCLDAIELDMRRVCPVCRTELESSGNCGKCRSGSYFNMSAFKFRDNLRELILMVKYASREDIGRYLGNLMAEHIERDILARADAILPVPLHPVKSRSRGYNQSELIADSLGAKLGIAVDTRSVRRIRNTQTQTQLGAHERKANVAGAFVAVENLSGKKFVILDDVITTGATTAEIARAIISAGGEVVCALAVATPDIEQSKEHGI